MENFLKVVKVFLNTLTALIIIIGLIFLILYAIGIQPFVVQSGSMEDEIKTGSLSFINKHVTYDKVKVGDIIGYTSSTKQNIMHRVVAIDSDGIHTKGDANEIEDGNVTTEKNYIGKAIFWIPKLGYAVATLQTSKGKVILGTVIVAIIAAAVLIGEPSKKKSIENNSNENDTNDDNSNKSDSNESESNESGSTVDKLNDNSKDDSKPDENKN